MDMAHRTGWIGSARGVFDAIADSGQLKGAPGFAMNLDGYHTMVVNHEMGHFLGFDHMLCPAAGQPAPVMQEETIDLAGCTPNAYPFAADGTFITGPWASS